jgi:hypothetical protein
MGADQQHPGVTLRVQNFANLFRRPVHGVHYYTKPRAVCAFK